MSPDNKILYCLKYCKPTGITKVKHGIIFYILRDLCHIIVDQQQRPNSEAVEDLFPDIVFSDAIKTEFNKTEKMLTKNARESEYRLNTLGDKNVDENPVGLDFEQYLLENGLKKGMFVNSFPTSLQEGFLSSCFLPVCINFVVYFHK